jgi:hypothetical protein
MALLMNMGLWVGLIIFDFLDVIQMGMYGISFAAIIHCLLAGIMAFTGAHMGIRFMQNIAKEKDYTVFALEEIKKDFDQMVVEKGNYYTWQYADTILDIPLDSSNRNTTTAEVPFLGILLHGYMNYTGEAINMAGDYEYTLLKTIENGANPYFVLAYKNISELKKNGYSKYYAVEYSVWKDTIIKEYKKLNEVLAPVQDQIITNHEILQERVVRVSYENGTEVYLNYNNFAVTVNGLEIPAMGFQAEVA